MCKRFDVRFSTLMQWYVKKSHLHTIIRPHKIDLDIRFWRLCINVENLKSKKSFYNEIVWYRMVWKSAFIKRFSHQPLDTKQEEKTTKPSWSNQFPCDVWSLALHNFLRPRHIVLNFFSLNCTRWRSTEFFLWASAYSSKAIGKVRLG